jgi:hypothetical protein
VAVSTPSRLPLALLVAVVFASLGRIFRLTLTLPAADSRRGNSIGSGGWRLSQLLGKAGDGMVVDGLPFLDGESHFASIVGVRSQLLPLLMRQGLRAGLHTANFVQDN